MKQELSHLVSTMPAHASLTVDGNDSRRYVYSLTGMGPDVFLQLALLGPRVCTMTVRAPAPIGNPATARRVLAGVRDWLLSYDATDQGYLELSTTAVAS
jgi:hypothetical protein